jgi:hypothetical protein
MRPRSFRPVLARAGIAVVIGATLLLRWAEAVGGLPAWAAGWGNDLVCLPLLLTATLFVHRFRGRGPGWRLPVAHGLAAVAFFGLVFELLLPRLDVRATADPWDLAAYLVGWAFFQVVINVPAPARGLPAAAR